MIKILFFLVSNSRNLFCSILNTVSFLVLLCSFVAVSDAQNIGINTTGAPADNKALLDINADNLSGVKGGLLIPRLTTAERDILSSTGTMTESLLIYNTTKHCFEAWNETNPGWFTFGCINCELPYSFTSASATDTTLTGFKAHWNASAGATGYFLDVSTSPTFSSFVTGYNNLSVGNVLSQSVAGLTAGTTYYYRVRASNSCGTSSNPNTVSVPTLSAPPPPPTLSAGCMPSQTEAAYGTVVTSLSGSSQTWITRNLGATANAISATDNSNAAAGCYFQFSKAQPYGYDNGGAVNPAWTVTSIAWVANWPIAADPCRVQLGGAWRLPTETEWTNASSGWNDYNDAYADVLKLHAAGRLAQATGNLTNRGVAGYFWSSSHDPGWSPTQGWRLLINSGGSSMGFVPMVWGYTVRCLK